MQLTRYALSIALSIVFLLHVVDVLPLHYLATLERQSYDARQRLTVPDRFHSQVVIVDIDEPSLSAIGRWPWSRSVLADLVDTLFQDYRIQAIGFDMVFAEKDEDEGVKLLRRMVTGPLRDNRAFLRAYQNAVDEIQRDERFGRSLNSRNTVLGFVMGTHTQKGMLPDPVAQLKRQREQQIPFISTKGYLANLDILQQSARSAGFIDNPLIDDDGVFRRALLLQDHRGALYESLALALSRLALGSPKLELMVRSNSTSDDLLLAQIKLGKNSIKVDAQTGVFIPYKGKRNSFPYLSAVGILDKTIPFDSLREKIVLLGTSAAGLHDLHPTPLDAAVPGVEIHANIVQGILDGTLKHQPAYATVLEFLMLLVLGLSLTWLLPRISPTRGLIFLVILLFAIVSSNLLLWSSYQLVLPLASPLLLILLLFTVHMTYGLFIETRKKQRLNELFGHYVPPELVEQISLNMRDIKLDGEIREMTVLFSDVRDFTALSEGLEPEELTQLINSFLTPMTAIIHHHRGTIDKYMGDAVMAFWGAPLQDSRHAWHALCAAIQMVQRLNELSAEFRARGWPELHIGIGINTGTMNVGNKGSEFRVDYTVLGDAVNLASRLEDLTKFYGVDIIVGENTYAAVNEFFDFLELDRVKVKGREATVAIYQPLGLADALSDSERADQECFQLALEHFRESDWDQAEQRLVALNEAHPERRLYRIYLDRIRHYRESPPPANWDGSFSHTSSL